MLHQLLLLKYFAPIVGTSPDEATNKSRGRGDGIKPKRHV